MSKSRNLNIIYSILILVAFTFAVRSSNNAFMTTIPLFVERYFHFTETDVGLIAGFSSLVMFFDDILHKQQAMRQVAQAPVYFCKCADNDLFAVDNVFDCFLTLSLPACLFAFNS